MPTMLAAPEDPTGVTDTVTDVVAPVIDTVEVLMILAIGGAIALALHIAIVRAVFRGGRGGRVGHELRRRCRWPARVTTTLAGVLAAVPVATPVAGLTELWRGRIVQVTTIAIIVAAAVLAVRAAEAIEAAVLWDYADVDLDDADVSPEARRRRTQATLLRRATTALIVILAVGGVLLTFDAVRSVGTSLLASAGILGLVAGIAAQNTLGNLIAGIQIAFAEPMQLGDVVIVEGEWGNIEEITLTYVIVRTWDRRRLVLPTAWFVQNPFQNWTRTSSQLVGVVFWQLDHRTPVDALRSEFVRAVESNPLWDGELAALLVTDTSATTIEVRGTMTARNSHDAWFLRCEIREHVIAWLRDHHPESLPSTRFLRAAPDHDHPPADAPLGQRLGAVPVDPVDFAPGPGHRDAGRPDDPGGSDGDGGWS
jgi:small-conductance mechanosensitive channel